MTLSDPPPLTVLQPGDGRERPCPDTDLTIVLAGWIQLWFASRPAIDLMLASRYQDGFLEFEALAQTVAVETLHKALEPKARVRSDQEFTAAKSRIHAALQTAIERGDCDPNDAAWVVGLLRNDYSFPRRATALAALADPTALAKVVPDVKVWVKALNAARNGLAHGGSGPERDRTRLLIERTR